MNDEAMELLREARVWLDEGGAVYLVQLKITYHDPQTGELKTVTSEYESTESVTAREWAEDEAYSLADKGHYQVEEITP